MMRQFKMAALVMVALMCAGMPGISQAGFIGETVLSQYYAYGGPYNGYGSPATFVADGTVQQSFCAGECPEGFNLIVRDSQIEYDLIRDGFWSFSGPSLNTGGLYIENGNLLTFTGVTISSVSIDAATTLAGFGAGNVTFNASNVAINWAGFSNIREGDRVVLDVTFAGTSVPEPATILLFGSGLAGLFAGKRWSRRTV